MNTNVSSRRLTSATASTSSSFLERVRAGGEQAWHDFFHRYAGMIREIGARRHLSPEECDDLLIDVMVIFWKKIDEFIYDRQRGRFRGYLAKITQFAVLKIRARKRREVPVPADLPPEYPSEVDAHYMDEWRDFLLEKALEELQAHVDTETYQVFYMSVFQHRSVAEIAAITRRTPNNIYVIRSRCLKRLREIVAELRQCAESELAGHSHSTIRARKLS